MNSKLFFGLTLMGLTLTAAAENTDVDMTPPTPQDPEDKPPFPLKIPARTPQVTITDGTQLNVDRIAADTSLAIEILRDGECIFSTFTLEHSVAIPMLDGPHTYTINLTINGTLWTGTYIQ